MPEITGSRWLVEGVLSYGRATNIFSPPGTGKSSLVAALLPALHLGGKFLGQTIHGSGHAALYVDFDETWDGSGLNIEAAMRGAGIPEGQPELGAEFASTGHMYVPGKQTYNGNPRAFGIQLLSYVKACNFKLVILDPLAGLLHGDVNSSGETRKALQDVLDPLLVHGCAVLLLDHTAKGQGNAKTPIGSVAKTGLVRIEAYLETTSGKKQTDTELPLTLTCTKSNLKKFKPISFVIARSDDAHGNLDKLWIKDNGSTPTPTAASPDDAQQPSEAQTMSKGEQAGFEMLEKLQDGAVWEARDLTANDRTYQRRLDQLCASEQVKRVSQGKYQLRHVEMMSEWEDALKPSSLSN